MGDGMHETRGGIDYGPGGGVCMEYGEEVHDMGKNAWHWDGLGWERENESWMKGSGYCI